MNPDNLPVADRVGRIHQLLQGLPGPYGNGEMFAWANLSDAAAVPHQVFELLGGAGLLEHWNPGRFVDVPDDPAELMTRLLEVDEFAAMRRFMSLVSTTMAYRMRGRYEEGKARQVFEALTQLLGQGTRWWTNTDDLEGWNPVTRHTFDAVVVGAGNGVIVTVLAFDED